MKTMTLALVLAAFAGCGGDKAKAKTTPVTPTPTPSATTEAPKQEPVVTGDQPVSPNLSVAGDIVAACGLKVSTSPTGAAPNFDYDKEELGPEDRAVLDQIATCLTTGALKGKPVSLIGRADPRGTEEYNLGLGSRRASTVSAYLKRLGVGDPQLGVTTRGAIDATGTDEEGWKKDRRVDIQLATPST